MVGNVRTFDIAATGDITSDVIEQSVLLPVSMQSRASFNGFVFKHDSQTMTIIKWKSEVEELPSRPGSPVFILQSSDIQAACPGNRRFL